MLCEMKKIITRPILLLLMAIFLLVTIVHGVIIIYSPSFQELNTIYEKCNADYQSGVLNEDTSLMVYLPGEDDLALSNEIQEKLSYYSNLEEDVQQIEQKLQSALFSSEADQNKLQKQLEDVKHNQSIELKFVNASYYLSVLQTGSMYYLCIVVIGFILSYYLIMVDQETGLLQLYQTTKAGLSKLFIHKVVSIVVAVIALFALKVGVQTVLLYVSGFPMDTPIQMIYTYSSFLGDVSALEYLILSNALNCILVLFIIFTFLLIYQLSRSTIISFACIGVGIFVEFLMHQLLSVISQWKLLKIINVFYILDMGNNDYFQYELSSVMWLFVVAGVLWLGVFCVYSLLYIKNVSFHKQIYFTLQPKWKKVFHFQLFDSYYLKKYIWIVLALIGYLTYDYMKYNVIRDPNVNVMNSVRQQYLGKLDEAYIQELDEKKQQYDSAIAQYYEKIDYVSNLQDQATDEMFMELDELSEVALEGERFNVVYEEIKMAYENGATYYVDNQGVKLWLQEDSSWYQGLLFFMIVIPAILFACTLGNHLYHTDISTIMLTTKHKSKYFFNTILLNGLNCVFLVLLVYFGRYMKFHKFFSVSLAGGSVNQYLSVPSQIPYSVYLGLYFFQYMLLVSTLTLFIIIMCKKMNYLQSILFGVLFTIVLYFMPFGIRYLIAPTYFVNIYCYISVVVLCVLNVVLVFYLARKS